jgi:hypothetical protein
MDRIRCSRWAGKCIAYFVAEEPAEAIHFDAKWDAKYRAVIRSGMADAKQFLADRLNFGEVDCDSEPEAGEVDPNSQCAIGGILSRRQAGGGINRRRAECAPPLGARSYSPGPRFMKADSSC